MYHQFLMKAADKNVLRFLSQPNPAANPEVYLMDVAIFDSACSPAIVQKHYVDDYLDCADTTEEAIEPAQQVRYIHSQAGLEIRNCVSNSAAFLDAMGESISKEGVSLNSGKDEASERVLGIIWRPDDEVFTFSTAMRSDLMLYKTSAKRPPSGSF